MRAGWWAAPSTRSRTASCAATRPRSACRPGSACSTPATPPTCSTSCARRRGVGQTGRRFPRKSTLLDIYSRTVNAQRPLRELLAEAFPWCERHGDDLARLFVDYGARKRWLGVIDLDDLLLYWRALAQDAVVGAQLAPAIDHLLVDEYQDVNGLQVDLVRGLRSERPDVTVVGDDLQAVYGFRSASPEHILEFPEHFPGAAVVTLERNYRADAAGARRRQRRGGDQAERAYRKAAARRAPRGRARPSSCCASTRPRRPTRSASACSTRASAAPRCASRRCSCAPRTTPTCSSSSSRAATSRTSSTAGCATSRPRTSRTSWPCCGWPTTRPTGWRGFAGCSCSRASGRRSRGACSRRSSPTPAACSTCSRAGRRRRRRSRPRRASRRTRSSRRWAPPPTSRRPACAPSGCATRSRRSSRRTTPTARSACWTSTRSWRPPASRPTSPASSPTSSSIRRRRARTSPGAGSLDEDWLVLSTVHSAKGLEWRSVHVLALYDGNFPSDLSAGDREAIEEERRLLYVALTRAQRDLHLYVPAALLPPPARRRRRPRLRQGVALPHRGRPGAVPSHRPHRARRRPRRRGHRGAGGARASRSRSTRCSAEPAGTMLAPWPTSRFPLRALPPRRRRARTSRSSRCAGCRSWPPSSSL